MPNFAAAPGDDLRVFELKESLRFLARVHLERHLMNDNHIEFALDMARTYNSFSGTLQLPKSGRYMAGEESGFLESGTIFHGRRIRD